MGDAVIDMSVSRFSSATVIVAVISVFFGLGIGVAARELVPNAPPAIDPIVIETSTDVVDSINTSTTTTSAATVAGPTTTTVVVGAESTTVAPVVSQPPQVAVPTAQPPAPTSDDDDDDDDDDNAGDG